MEQAQAHPLRYTVEQYLALEEKSEIRHEYFQGEIMAMAGTTTDHNELCLNCAIKLRQAVLKRGCRVFMENIQLAVNEGELYTYPDVMLTCHDEDVVAPRIMRHPLLLIEVLSPSTAEHDRVWKLFRYQRITSLRHYVLVSQQYQAVEWYHRVEEGGEWQRHLLTLPHEAVEIPELDTRLTLTAIYASLKIPFVTDDKIS
jgi:Uma2 family endonuclease